MKKILQTVLGCEVFDCIYMYIYILSKPCFSLRQASVNHFESNLYFVSYTLYKVKPILTETRQPNARMTNIYNKGKRLSLFS